MDERNDANDLSPCTTRSWEFEPELTTAPIADHHQDADRNDLTADPAPDFNLDRYLRDACVETLCVIQATHVITLTPPSHGPNYSNAVLQAQLQGWEASINAARLGSNWMDHADRIEGWAVLNREGTVPSWNVIARIPRAVVGIDKAVARAWAAVVPGGKISVSPVTNLEQAIRLAIEPIQIDHDPLGVSKHVTFLKT